MERESFEDEEVAEILNKNYVSIKVDREERPDLDHIYMTVCQAMTGHGGWPLTLILTPDQKPFFAGTYFPKEPRFGGSGLIQILNKISGVWSEEKDRAHRVGTEIMSHVEDFLNPTEKGKLDPEIFDHAYEQFARQFDHEYGGFGDSPKFPRAHDLLFLLRYWKQTNDSEALQMVTDSLEYMARGGIFDHLGGGFSRYSVDREWLTPHFEKMLYDQAMLAMAYVETYQATGEQKFAQIAERIYEYVLRDLSSEDGGFYSAEDADSEGEEGKFYVWRPEEILEVLGDQDGDLFCRAYHVTDEGNFEDHTSILNQIHISLPMIAETSQMTLKDLEEKLASLKRTLFAEREKRVRPHLDDKILTSWNGLMIAAFAIGGRALGHVRYLDAATRAAGLIQEKLMNEQGRLLVRYRDGHSNYLGYLDDYANYVWGLIELYQSTFHAEYLSQAVHLTKEMIRLFQDTENGGFYLTGSDAEELLTRSKEIYDGAIPSGNSVAAYNLIRLAKLTSDEEFLKEADEQFESFAGTVQGSPISHSFYLAAAMFAYRPTKEIVISGDPTHSATKEMIREVQQRYLPNAVIALHPVGETSDNMKHWIPLVKGDIDEKHDTARVYICENYACQTPITQVEKLREQLT